jgi:hypothetical protein
MALGFFYRNQKIVFIVMILLMVAFLLPGVIQGVGGGGNRDVVGRIDGEKITGQDVVRAANEVELLTTSLQMGRLPAMQAFLRGTQDMGPGLPWLMLLHEAERLGIEEVPEGEVEQFLAEVGMAGEPYEKLIARLAERRISEETVRTAIGHFLMIEKAFNANQVTSPPSLPELRFHIRQFKEQIRLAMLVIPAERYLGDVREPTEQEVRQFFDRYREAVRGGPDNQTRFGFGYRVGEQVDLAWLLVDLDLIERAVSPSEEQVMSYWRENQERIYREVEVPTGRTGPSGEPEMTVREEPVTNYSEAYPIIRERLLPVVAQDRAEVLARQARQTIENLGEGPDVHERAAKAMIEPAEDLLDSKVGSLPEGPVALDELIEQVEATSGVRIVYPFGTHGELTIDRDLEVKPEPGWSRAPLGRVLAGIAEAAELPEMKWVACRGLGNAIFPAEPVDLKPVRAGWTGMMSVEEVYEHEVLGQARASSDPASMALLQVLATAPPFQRPGADATPLIQIGQDYRKPMVLSGDPSGLLLWRLLVAKPPHTPEKLTPEIREQIVEDFKTMKAYEVAVTEARKLFDQLRRGERDLATRAAPSPATAPATATAPADSGEDPEEAPVLERLAAEHKLELVRTEPFSRVTLNQRTLALRPTFVEGVGTNTDFLAKAFELVPEDLATQPAGDRPATVVELPRQTKALVIQRIGYEPATEEDLRELIVTFVPRQVPVEEDGEITWTYRIQPIYLNHLLMRRRQANEMALWFAWEAAGGRAGISARVEFEPTDRPEQDEEVDQE